MGPITIFDKSALQALNPDEAVLFDNFFYTNITPLFFAETLADLEKEVATGKTPAQAVGSIAYRTPVLSSSPNSHHYDTCVSNLLGQDVPMDGRMLRAGARQVSLDGKAGVVYEQAPEMEALDRWCKGEFLDVEQNFARAWRDGLKEIDLERDSETFKHAWKSNAVAKNLVNAKGLADRMVEGQGREYEVLRTALQCFDVPKELWTRIGERWNMSGKPPLTVFAPYAAYVLTVDFFFYLAVSAGLISSVRANNRIDVAYLYYLPFCMMFVSNDKLHRRTAPLFLRNDQEFVWGEDLKNDLSRLDDHYSAFPDEIRELGLMRFASRPPLEGDFLTTSLWDKFMSPRWRDGTDEENMEPPVQNKELVEMLSKWGDAPTVEGVDEQLTSDDVNSMVIKRSVPAQKGKWRILPPGVEDND